MNDAASVRLTLTRIRVGSAWPCAATGSWRCTGWDDLIFTHISVRAAGPEHHFLINPYGWLFSEITASSLVRSTGRGRKVDASSAPGERGGVPHPQRDPCRARGRAVRAPRAALGQRGRRVAQPTHGLCECRSGALAYHDYEGVASDVNTRRRASSATSGQAPPLNHGPLTVGETVADAFVRMYFLEPACMMQVRAQAGGGALNRCGDRRRRGGAMAARDPRRRRWPRAGRCCRGSTASILPTGRDAAMPASARPRLRDVGRGRRESLCRLSKPRYCALAFGALTSPSIHFCSMADEARVLGSPPRFSIIPRKASLLA